MNIENLKNKWVEFVDKMNSLGIPVPMVRNPKTGYASVSLTLVFISFNVWLVSIVGKAAGFFGGVNPDQAFNMVIAAFSLYFGRNLSLSKDDKKLTQKDEEK